MHNHLFHYVETPTAREKLVIYTDSDVINEFDFLFCAAPSAPFDEIYLAYESDRRTAKETIDLAYTLAAQAHMSS